MSQEQFSPYEHPPTDTSPRPFGEIPGLWLKITQMTEEFFAQEAPRASGANVLISILILAAATTVLAMISSLIFGGVQMAFLPPEYREAAAMGVGQGVLLALCSGVFGTIIGFYIGNGITYLAARALGGSGDFGTQLYLQSLFAVPIGIASGLVNLVPYLGCVIALALSIYAIVLNVRAVKVAHNMTTGRAVAAIFVPGLIVGLIVACFVVVVLVLLGPSIAEIFEDMAATMY